jgi:hypothetical protein
VKTESQLPGHGPSATVTSWGLISLLILAGTYWLLSSTVLWLAYDIGAQIRGGYYNQSQALALVAKMSLIVTVLTSAIWLSTNPRKLKVVGWRVGLGVAWKTWVLLMVYVLVVLMRRQLWSPSQGNNDGAMFLPIVGHTNAQFLSEFRWLSFLIQVIPILGFISGGLYLLRARLQGLASAPGS